jgi:hypothetical protein
MKIKQLILHNLTTVKMQEKFNCQLAVFFIKKRLKNNSVQPIKKRQVASNCSDQQNKPAPASR